VTVGGSQPDGTAGGSSGGGTFPGPPSAARTLPARSHSTTTRTSSRVIGQSAKTESDLTLWPIC